MHKNALVVCWQHLLLASGSFLFHITTSINSPHEHTYIHVYTTHSHIHIHNTFTYIYNTCTYICNTYTYTQHIHTAHAHTYKQHILYNTSHVHCLHSLVASQLLSLTSPSSSLSSCLWWWLAWARRRSQNLQRSCASPWWPSWAPWWTAAGPRPLPTSATSPASCSAPSLILTLKSRRFGSHFSTCC